MALRISLEELRGRPGRHGESEAHEVVTLLADLPDLWDVKMDSSPTDCAPSRFSPEASHEPVIDFVKRLTSRPVVGVGRFTSPDTMVSQIRRGVLDLIGGARASIADPFLPSKIREGREQDIRECIGCNICISSWHDGVPVRCTQNPTAGEEWRRDWHPERVARAASDASVLVVGGGPSGLECALTLGRRGYAVTLADSAREFGGRLRFETRLPGLATWGRVRDWRLSQLAQLSNVTLYPGNELDDEQILELEHTHVVVATGARWSRMLYSAMEVPIAELDVPGVYTPDDVAAGATLEAPVVVFDFDNYYLGGVLAEHLAAARWTRQLRDARGTCVGMDHHDQRAAASAPCPGARPCRPAYLEPGACFRRSNRNREKPVHRRRDPIALPIVAHRRTAAAERCALSRARSARR